jgi:hypothetical protein
MGFVAQDPKTVAGVYGSISIWALGYPDRALRMETETETWARHLGNPFDLGFALVTGAHQYDRRWQPHILLKRAEECERLGRENSLPVLWGMLASREYGLALIRAGQFADGIAGIKTCLSLWEASGGRAMTPTMKMFLAMALSCRTTSRPHAMCWRRQSPKLSGPNGKND